MANHARGEADLTIAGKTYAVRMSMGALARMSAALDVKGMAELNDRLLEFRLADMPVIIDAVLRGNGYEVAMADIEAMDWQDYFKTVIPAFFRTGADQAPEAAGTGGRDRPPRRQKTVT